MAVCSGHLSSLAPVYRHPSVSRTRCNRRPPPPDALYISKYQSVRDLGFILGKIETTSTLTPL